MDFRKDMADLIESVCEGSTEDLKYNKDKIIEIATYCRARKAFLRNEQKTREFTKNMSAEDCYRHMIAKIANAPFQIMVEATAILFMPVICDKLNGSDKP